jgi:hypothetical protein
MLELITNNLPLIAVFIMGTLVPSIIEHFNTLFFTMPENFVHFVNTTVVPHFGDKGGKLILVSTQFAVAVIQHFGKALVVIVKTVMPLVVYVAKTLIPLIIELGSYVYPVIVTVLPFVKSVVYFLDGLLQEIVFFFSWTKDAMTSQFGKFMFHVFLLYFSVHCLFYFGKRLLKKIV